MHPHTCTVAGRMMVTRLFSELPSKGILGNRDSLCVTGPFSLIRCL